MEWIASAATNRLSWSLTTNLMKTRLKIAAKTARKDLTFGGCLLNQAMRTRTGLRDRLPPPESIASRPVFPCNVGKEELGFAEIWRWRSSSQRWWWWWWRWWPRVLFPSKLFLRIYGTGPPRSPSLCISLDSKRKTQTNVKRKKAGRVYFPG